MALRSTDKCMVCGDITRPYFTKDFTGAYNLDVVEYVRCMSCGHVCSKTHAEMSEDAWSSLIGVAHHYQDTDANPDDPQWRSRQITQHQAIHRLRELGAIPAERPWLDWGAGDGRLAQLLQERGIRMQNYDKFMPRPGYLDDKDLKPGAFDFVITTSVMEHVRDIKKLDEISSLVSPNGVFAVHTMVREEVPADPTWFYLMAVHVSFFTNCSMEHLFQKWGFASSLYHVPGRLWFFFKNPSVRTCEIASAENAREGKEVFFAKEGAFADYWNEARTRKAAWR